MVLWVHIKLFSGCLVLITGMFNVKAWTYHYNIDSNMEWTAARQWCQTHFTDMVAIQNQVEIAYLNEVLPFNRAYYWIGIRKVDGLWTWVGTKKRLAPEAANWATNEPNNQGSGEDCVEIYIKRNKDTAKWNDERCSKKKAAVCYLASCSEKSCSEHAECVETIGNYKCQCEPGFMGPRCDEAVKCGPINDPPHGWKVSCFHPHSNNSFNSSCEFECMEGFELKGSKTTWCNHTGDWTHKTPTCTAVTCDPLLTPANSNLTCADPLGKFSFRSSCNVTCDEGYKLKGSATLSCLKAGNWSAPTPSCDVVKCDPLKPTLRSSLQCGHPVEEFAYGSTCWLKCDFGFVHNGTNSTHCTKQGNWSHIPPVCHAIQCPPLSSAPVNGNMSCIHPLSSDSYNSSCEFKCEEGFVLRGTDSILCDHTGHWKDKTPICTAIVCDPLVTPANSKLTCADPLGKFSFRSSCNVICEEGYKLRGATALNCLSNANWSAPTPACEVIRCDALESLQHGAVHCQDKLEEFSYGSECWFECQSGFTLNGTNFTHCTSQGKWNWESPVCQAQQCRSLSDPSHGIITCTHPHGQFSFGTVCKVSCQAGFKLHGTPQLECLEMGKWTDTPPLCLAQECPLLSAPENGWMNCSHPHSLFSYESQCSLECETGFEITGQPGMQCSASGNWSQEVPSCAAVHCEPLLLTHLSSLGPPPSVNCSHPHGNFSFGSQCVFWCAKNHELNGTSQLFCTSTGHWTSSPPSCVVMEMSLSAGLLINAVVGAVSAAGLLLLGGLMFLLTRQFNKKAFYSLNDSSKEGDLNLAFELN